MSYLISSKYQLEDIALKYGVLPFFRNEIPGFSVQEMAPPDLLFAPEEESGGCWEWKGPVIQNQTLAYGKFFNRKAGFVSLDLLPEFINYRRMAYPVTADSTEGLILEIIREQEGVTSTKLKKIIHADLPSCNRRKSLEGPLQRLQMAGRLLIADFIYKRTSRGEPYGWGVALYSTPEIWFEREFPLNLTLKDAYKQLIHKILQKNPGISEQQLAKLIK